MNPNKYKPLLLLLTIVALYNNTIIFAQAVQYTTTANGLDKFKQTNLISAFIELLNNPKNYKIDHWNKLALLPEIINFVSTNKDTHYPTKSDLDFILNLLKRTK